MWFRQSQYHLPVRLRIRQLGHVAATLALGVVGCGPAPVAAPKVPTVQIGTSGAGGSFRSLAQALAPELKARVATLNVEMVLSHGAIDNLQGVARGQFECGFTYADAAYEALVSGQIDGREMPMSDVRAIAVMQVTPLQLIARSKSGITRIEDLRDKRVGVRSSAGGLISKVVREAQATGTEAQPMTSLRAPVSDMMAAGELDAAFGTVMYSEGFAAAIAEGAYLVPITGPVVDRLRREQPFLRTVLIPPGIYGTSQQAVPTLGVESLLVCRRQLEDAPIRDLTRALLESLQVLAKSKQWNLVSMEEAPATSIPLHSGAALYYREVELQR